MESTIFNDENDLEIEAVNKIKIELNFMNTRDDSLKYVCMTVFGIFSAYATATIIMNVYGR